MKLSEMSKTTSSKTNASKTKTINEAYDELKNCSSEELMQRLAKEIQTQKTNGTFDFDALKSSIDKIKDYLPAQTYQNMIRIIESLK